MDERTLNRYEEFAGTYIDRYRQVRPGRMYELMATFFKSKGKTLDIGCASGRDLAYLKGAGFDIEGLDAVAAFVQHCQETLPNITIHYDSLPALSSIDNNLYDNILLSAVLMHVSKEDLTKSVKNLLRIIYYRFY